MNARQVAKKLRSLLRRRAGVALAKLPAQLQAYGQTGVVPADPLAKSYVALTESALVAMDQSIGGDEYTAACEKYSTALENWKLVMKESGV